MSDAGMPRPLNHPLAWHVSPPAPQALRYLYKPVADSSPILSPTGNIIYAKKLAMLWTLLLPLALANPLYPTDAAPAETYVRAPGPRLPAITPRRGGPPRIPSSVAFPPGNTSPTCTSSRRLTYYVPDETVSVWTTSTTSTSTVDCGGCALAWSTGGAMYYARVRLPLPLRRSKRVLLFSLSARPRALTSRNAML